MATCLSSDKSLAFLALTVLLSIVLTNLRLQSEIVPLHVCLDQVGNWPDDWGEQTYVRAVDRDTWHVESEVFVQLMQVCHLVIDAGRLGDDCLRSFLLSLFEAHFRNEDLGGLRFPVVLGGWLLSDTQMGYADATGSGACAPAGSNLRFLDLTSAISVAPNVCHCGELFNLKYYCLYLSALLYKI